ncbi:MAG TPA: DUF4919 domain-containing protein [Longimicrobium sp.]|nr:DUF4919 domain-containing protein [Longimicrobium sp.]
MRTAALTLLLLCSLAFPARAQDAAAYRTLLARAQAGDTTVDYTALRKAWAASPEYAPYGSDADEHADSMRAALQRRDWARAVREADAVLAVTWLDARTHAMKAYAAEQLGDTEAAGRERGVVARIVQSVAASGKGTQQSPFVVVTVAEEYAYLGVNGFERGDQALDRCGSRACDRMEAANPATGEKRTFYFDVTLPTEHLRRALGGGGKKP